MSKPLPKDDTLKRLSYELVNAYFDLEDKIKNYRLIKEEIEKKFNISMTPIPQCFKGIPEDVALNFNLVSNYSSEVKTTDMDKLRDSINQLDEELEQWMEKATLIEIRMAKMKKNHIEYHLLDPELRKLIKTVENLAKDEYDFSDEEEEMNTGAFGVKIESHERIETEPQPENMTADQLNDYINERLQWGAKMIKKGLEKINEKATWTKSNEIEKNLFFVLNSVSDAEYIKNLQINDEKITVLENEVHQLEKKASNLTNYYEKFEDKYLKDPVRKSVVKQTDLEKKVAIFSRRIDCVRNMKKYSSDSCLVKKSAYQTLIGNCTKRKELIRTLHFMHEMHFTFFELTQVNTLKKKQEMFDLKKRFQNVMNKRTTNADEKTLTLEVLQAKLETVKDAHFRELMKEQLANMKGAMEARVNGLDEMQKIDKLFDAKLKNFKSQAEVQMEKCKKLMESFEVDIGG